MAVLSAHKRIDYVVPGKPFGSGVDGNATVSANPNTRDTASGSAASTTLTTGGSTFANGDILLLHQTRGTGVKAMEFVKVLSGGGTNTLTLTKPLVNSYTTSGASAAQAIKVPQNDVVTVNAHTITAWDGSKGGIEVIAAKTSITVSGAVAGSGGAGTQSGGESTGATGGGFRGGNGRQGQNSGMYGEGSAGNRGYASNGNANGNGGGGGKANGSSNNGSAGGGGGSYTGSNGGSGGGTNTSYAWLPSGGTGVSATDATEFTLGGGGGGAGNGATEGGGAGSGGSGGAWLILISKSITLSSTVTTSGGVGGNGWRAGGGGAGGGTLLMCITASIGTNNIVSDYGGGGSSSSSGTGGNYAAGEGDSGSSTDSCGGNGRKGIVAIHHSGAVTGTSNPTFFDQSDPSLKEGGASGNPVMFQGGGLALG